MRVSVVMPVYDPHPDYFREAVRSVLQQTLSDLELLVVEDTSPRSAAALLEEFDDPRIRHLLRCEKGSIVDSLNRGLEEARAEWVARADADDICEPDRLEKQFAFLRENPRVEVLGSQLAIIDARGMVEGYRNYPLSHEEIVRALARYNALAHPAVLFKKERVLGAGGYRRFYAEDYELWSRLAKHQVRFANHPEPLVRYRVIPEGIRAAKVREALRATLEVKRLYWREEMNLGDRLQQWAERGLLYLPPRLVLWLFRKTRFRSTVRSQGRPRRSPLISDL
jgi:glycosyltransferase involved in cell wall biosynthesis